MVGPVLQTDRPAVRTTMTLNISLGQQTLTSTSITGAVTRGKLTTPGPQKIACAAYTDALGSACGGRIPETVNIPAPAECVVMPFRYTDRCGYATGVKMWMMTPCLSPEHLSHHSNSTEEKNPSSQSLVLPKFTGCVDIITQPHFS